VAAVGGTGTSARKGLMEDGTSYASASHGGLFSSHICHPLKHWGSQKLFYGTSVEAECILESKSAAMLRAGKITVSLCLLALVIWRFRIACGFLCSAMEVGSLGTAREGNTRRRHLIHVFKGEEHQFWDQAAWSWLESSGDALLSVLTQDVTGHRLFAPGARAAGAGVSAPSIKLWSLLSYSTLSCAVGQC